MEFVLGTKKAEKPQSKARGRSWFWAIVALTAVSAAVIVAVFASEPGTTGPAGTADAGTTHSSPAPTPIPGVPPTEESVLDPGSAETLIKTVLETVATTPATSDPSIVLANVAVGGYLEEIDAQYQELEANGWTVSGQPTIESSSVLSIDTDRNPASAVVSACIDSTAVTMLDLAGKPVGGQTSPRSIHLFSLEQQTDGTWKVAAHWFPNDPAC